jgi:AraC-like DNA-binding protein
MSQTRTSPFQLLAPPYTELLPLGEDEDFPRSPRTLRGVALVWRMASGHRPGHLVRASGRPGGLALIAILPPSERVIQLHDRVLEVLEEARPLAVLPHHPMEEVGELRALLRKEPENPGSEFLDFLKWRGLAMDQETRRIVSRTMELSGELRTLGALARGVYLSRRALGRRFQQRGLPVPSHWLQFCRLLRVLYQLQNTQRPLSTIARSLGYPDGFTLSNQMERRVGVRPSVVRERLGWEWFAEAWLRKEWEDGGLTRPLRGYDLASAERERRGIDVNRGNPHVAVSEQSAGFSNGEDHDDRTSGTSEAERSGAAA